ncbi:MAG: hypothetical protein J7L34_09045 [Thermotogaceae bacterium]|nr:hypothetical protein [Thermotogaceae bacterium]
MVLSKNPVTVVFPMAFPGRQNTDAMLRGEPDERYLMDGLKAIAEDPYFKGIEVTRIKDPVLRKKAVEYLKATDLTIYFGAQPVQILNEEGYAREDISSVDEIERLNCVERLKEMIDQAYEFGAVSFIFQSGKDPGTDLRESAKLSLIRSIVELARYSRERAKELGREPLKLVLETFDRVNSDHGTFHNQLIGPTKDAIDIARRVRDEYGIEEFGILYDLSHMYLLRNVKTVFKEVEIEVPEIHQAQEAQQTQEGEQQVIQGRRFTVTKAENVEEPEAPEVLKYLIPYLVHIHIGNCVLDPNDPLYGDTHPTFAYPNGAIKLRDVADFVKALHEMGYEGPVGFEVRPRGREGSIPTLQHAKAFYDDARTWQDVIHGPSAVRFATRNFFPEWAFFRLTDFRVKNPDIIVSELSKRKRKEKLTEDGYLVILAADHPARGVISSPDSPIGMADRLEYLGRILRVATSPYVDGVMASPDIIDDLVLINYMFKEAGLKPFLDDKILIGSMNRSGISGVVYEMEDRLTAYTTEDLVRYNLDAGKLLFRLETGKYSRFSIQTLSYCAEAIRKANQHGIPMFVEPLPVEREDETQPYRVKTDVESMVKIVGIASGIGGSSARLWLKIPYIEGFNRVARATTLPILILGGDSPGDPTYAIENVSKALASAPNVRGSLIGRNVLFPGRDDPRAIAKAIYEVVHNSLSAAEALEVMLEERYKDINLLKDVFMEVLKK